MKILNQPDTISLNSQETIKKAPFLEENQPKTSFIEIFQQIQADFELKTSPPQETKSSDIHSTSELNEEELIQSEKLEQVESSEDTKDSQKKDDAIQDSKIEQKVVESTSIDSFVQKEQNLLQVLLAKSEPKSNEAEEVSIESEWTEFFSEEMDIQVESTFKLERNQYFTTEELLVSNLDKAVELEEQVDIVFDVDSISNASTQEEPHFKSVNADIEKSSVQVSNKDVKTEQIQTEILSRETSIPSENQNQIPVQELKKSKSDEIQIKKETSSHIVESSNANTETNTKKNLEPNPIVEMQKEVQVQSSKEFVFQENSKLDNKKEIRQKSKTSGLEESKSSHTQTVKEVENTKDTLQLDKNKWTIQRNRSNEQSESSKIKPMEMKRQVAEEIREQTAQVLDKSNGPSEIKSNPVWTTNSVLSTLRDRYSIQIKQSELSANKEILQKTLNELVHRARVNILENGKSSAQIVLNPRELGKVTLHIQVQQDRIDGKLFVESESAKFVVLSELKELKSDLQAMGLQLDQLQVEVGGQNHFQEEYDLENGQLSTNKKQTIDEENQEVTEVSYKETDKLIDILV